MPRSRLEAGRISGCCQEDAIRAAAGKPVRTLAELRGVLLGATGSAGEGGAKIELTVESPGKGERRTGQTGTGELDD